MIIYDLIKGVFTLPEEVSKEDVEKAISAIASKFDTLRPDAEALYYNVETGKMQMAITVEADEVPHILYAPNSISADSVMKAAKRLKEV